jgi:hypothetical protein
MLVFKKKSSPGGDLSGNWVNRVYPESAGLGPPEKARGGAIRSDRNGYSIWQELPDIPL